MKVKLAKDNGTFTFTVAGDINTPAARELGKELHPAFEKAKRVELDFSQVAYATSELLRILRMAQDISTTKNVPMTLRNVSEPVMNMFRLTRFDAIVTIVP